MLLFIVYGFHYAENKDPIVFTDYGILRNVYLRLSLDHGILGPGSQHHSPSSSSYLSYFFVI